MALEKPWSAGWTVYMAPEKPWSAGWTVYMAPEKPDGGSTNGLL